MLTGTFFRSPGQSLERELAMFQRASDTLDIRTYEFTHKDFKTTLKKLADADVRVRIVIEDKKYKQYQNTFRELVKYFS